MSAGTLPVTWADVRAAATRLEGRAHRTPVMTSRTADERSGASVFFKCENLQRMGAFKFRGAFNALSQLSSDERSRGVLAYSSGNHAQAVALAGRELGIRTTIVMPEDAPAVKIEATRGYGAEVLLYDRHTVNREEYASRVAGERGLAMIPPFDHAHVIAGQGTAAKELIDDTGPLDILLVPCGGGGLISGCAVAAAELAPHCRVIGVEPAAGDDVTRSFRSRTLQTCHNPDTIADGARTHSLGQLTFPLVMALVAEMLTVEDDALIRAMRFFAERMKLVVEPTGTLAAAALFEGLIDARGKRVGVILSGGNVDLRDLARWIG